MLFVFLKVQLSFSNLVASSALLYRHSLKKMYLHSVTPPEELGIMRFKKDKKKKVIIHPF